MAETARRRTIQTEHNVRHGITPYSVIKSVDQVRFITRVADARVEREAAEQDRARAGGGGLPGRRVAEGASAYADPAALIEALEKEMKAAAAALDFEAAARLRDQLFEVKAKRGGGGGDGRRGGGSLAGLRTVSGAAGGRGGAG